MKDTTKKIAEILGDEPIVVMFSTGKDSVVMSDLLVKHYKGRMEFVFMYFVPGLEIKQRIIDHYEKRWGVKIHQMPHFYALSLKTGKSTNSGTSNAGSGPSTTYPTSPRGYAGTIPSPGAASLPTFLSGSTRNTKSSIR